MTTAQLAPKTTNKSLKLTPKVHPVIKRFIEEKATLFQLVQALGSPLNVIFPELLHDNVENFRQAFSDAGVIGKVFFAHKCNQSDSLVRRLAVEEAYLDVSSANELRHALGAGFEATRIEATGPKNVEFIGLAVQQGVTIAVDSIYELNTILKLK
ncbi:MAG TPA: hypothetical protein PL012_20440, partial [Candidatus Obscuribacter sp.]|nr:hypothetical protein [Candidatus Obscuribacter sp.]